MANLRGVEECDATTLDQFAAFGIRRCADLRT
jgi:hypothetical protein